MHEKYDYPEERHGTGEDGVIRVCPSLQACKRYFLHPNRDHPEMHLLAGARSEGNPKSTGRGMQRPERAEIRL